MNLFPALFRMSLKLKSKHIESYIESYFNTLIIWGDNIYFNWVTLAPSASLLLISNSQLFQLKI